MTKTDPPSDHENLLRLSDIGEFGLIERLRQLAGHPGGQVRVGIGDDAAVWRPSPGHELVMTCDAHIEGRHFLPPKEGDWLAAEHIGRRCAAANLSDVAAMGAQPRFALVSLGIPKDKSVHLIENLYKGIVSALGQCDAVIIGGNITSTKGPLFVDITLAGEIPFGQSVLRSGARAGDWIGVTGKPGHSAAGLQAWLTFAPSWEAQEQARWKELTDCYFLPEIRVAFAKKIGPLLRAMTDVSDGLLADLQNMLDADSLGAILEKDAIPCSPLLRELALKTSVKPESFLLGASDDYELLFCVEPEGKEKVDVLAFAENCPVHWLGKVQQEPGVFLQEGEHRTLIQDAGWDHF